MGKQLTEEMARLDLKRKITMHSQHFLSVPVTVMRTDMVACVPYHFAKHFDVERFEVPFDLPFIEYYFYWSIQAEHNAAHSWMREQMQILAQEFAAKYPTQMKNPTQTNPPTQTKHPEQNQLPVQNRA
jgi:DNA-binding transcriptional LysR family regulator